MDGLVFPKGDNIAVWKSHPKATAIFYLGGVLRQQFNNFFHRQGSPLIQLI